MSNKTQWCACAAQNNDTGSLINESCPQAPFVCTSGDYGPLSNKTQWCACAAQNNDTGSLINESCPQAPRSTTTPTARPTQQPTASPRRSGVTVTKIQINGQNLDLNRKLKITLPDTFKTLNPQTKIDVTYSDNTTRSFYLGFRYIAPTASPTPTVAATPTAAPTSTPTPTTAPTTRPTPVATAAPTAAPVSTPTPRPSPTLSPALRIYDLNEDHKINAFDTAIFIKNWQQRICTLRIDFDRNEHCNAIDYALLVNQL